MPQSDWLLSGAVEQETNKTLYNTKDELKTMITAEFTNLNKETNSNLLE